ncbi:hypothetical protein BH09BAC2_BH09BAC2_15080 [soil metagenome]
MNAKFYKIQLFAFSLLILISFLLTIFLKPNQLWMVIAFGMAMVVILVRGSLQFIRNSQKKILLSVGEHSQELLKSIIDCNNDGIIACDASGNLTLINPGVRKLHGIHEGHFSIDVWLKNNQLYYADGRGRMKTEDVPLYRALRGEKVINEEVLLIHADNSKKYARVTGVQLNDGSGNVTGAVLSMHDITDIKSELKN